MLRTKIAFILLIILVAAIAGCGGDGKKESGESMDNSMTSGADFVAKVDGVVIADKEVSQELAMLRQQMAGRVSAQQLDSMKPMLKQQAVANLVNRALLTEAAEKENITVTADEVETKYEEIRANFPDEEAFVAQLGRSNMTTDEFRVEVERGMKLEELVNIKTADITAPTSEEAKEFYDSNSERFTTPERVRASHILITVAETDTEITREQKKAKIDDLHTQLVAGADTSENTVSKPDLGLFGGNERTYLGHEHKQSHLADVGAFARHVRPGDQQDRARHTQVDADVEEGWGPDRDHLASQLDLPPQRGQVGRPFE